MRPQGLIELPGCLADRDEVDPVFRSPSYSCTALTSLATALQALNAPDSKFAFSLTPPNVDRKYVMMCDSEVHTVHPKPGWLQSHLLVRRRSSMSGWSLSRP